MPTPYVPLPEPTDEEKTAGIRAGVDEAQYVDQNDIEKAKRQSEEKVVAKFFKEYKQARDFDKDNRKQYAVDRRYAAGTADPTWAVNTNLIGSFIDILVSFLYARNPDVSVRKAPQVDDIGSRDNELLARTMEIVITRLWKKSALKRNAKKMVRAALTTGIGWLKVIMVADSPDMPEVQGQMNDLRDNLAALQAVSDKLEDPSSDAYCQTEALIAEKQELMASLEQKVEVAIRKYLAVDFVSSEDMQISTDVRNIEDYLDAGWCSNAIYRPKTKLKQLFPRLTDEDVKQAKVYFQRRTKDLTPLGEQVNLGGQFGDVNADEAEQYTTSDMQSGQSSDSNSVEFVKIIEIWDHETNHIKTAVDGTKVWAKDPYQPAYPSSRFFPYFMLSFYEVDGLRHSQSLPQREAKLQDEYARSRSSWRLMRERAIPGTLFNARGMDDAEMAKIERSVHQEYVGIKPTDANARLSDMFTPKPVSSIDPRLYDTAPILADMEKIAGVQEALQSAVTQEKTATEAQIQQTGFASRTTADRDVLEDVLTDMASYTAELTLTALKTRDVQRLAGPAAFWPENMDIEDLLTMVEVEIQAGTTGKPRANGDRDAWGVLMPQIKEAIMQIQQAQLQGNTGLSQALTELLKETMIRMGDDTDISRFIPAMPGDMTMPGAPGAVAVPPTGADPASSPSPGPPGAGAPSGAPGLVNPATEVPSIQNPTN